MTQSNIDLTIQDQIATITLNRPEKLNALTPTMLDHLAQIADQLEADSSVRVVLLTGAGDRAFCVGADINAWSALEPLDMWRQWIRHGHRIYDRLANLSQPLIAVLNGYTLGGGLELALTADIRLAAEPVKLALPEVKLGTIPGWAGTKRLPDLIGPARAKQMIFTGGQISAQQALDWGLINAVFPATDLMKTALNMAREISHNAPLAVQMTKQLINGSQGQATLMILESLASGLAAHTADGREGVEAFREKRPPVFKGE